MRKINLTKGLKKSKYKKFSIYIKGLYEWGNGIVAPERNISIINGLYNRIGQLENCYVKPGDNFGGCPVLLGMGITDETNVYLHPMEFTGYATDSTIKKLEKILSSSENVESIETTKEEVYDCDDDDYRKVLTEHVEEISQLFNEYRDSMSDKEYAYSSFPFDFVRENRFERVNAPIGISSLDCDIRFLTDCLLPMIDRINK